MIFNINSTRGHTGSLLVYTIWKAVHIIEQTTHLPHFVNMRVEEA